MHIVLPLVVAHLDTQEKISKQNYLGDFTFTLGQSGSEHSVTLLIRQKRLQRNLSLVT